MSDLPKSWTEVPVTEVLELNNNGKFFQQGWSPQCETYLAPANKWGVLKTTAIQHGEFRPDENKLLPDDLEPRPHLEVKPGDILMTCAGPRSRCGVACLVTDTRQKLMMSGKMYRFRPNPEAMHAKYLMYFLLTRVSQLAIDKMKTGISDSGLNLTHDRFATLNVPVAPLNEQRRIVGKMGELFSELQDSLQSVRAARAQIPVYRQAILKHAFEGHFTTTRRTRSGAVHPPHPMSPSETTAEGLLPLPTGWEYVRLGHLIDPERPITYGVIKLGPAVADGIPTLRSSDVRRLRLDLGSVKRISPKVAENFRRTFLNGGEVLITVRGTLGGVAVVPSRLAGWNISREVAMIVPGDTLDASYLQYFIASPQLEAWVKRQLRGVAYTGINLASLRDAPIAFCHIDEQREIARMLAEQLSLVDSIENDIEEQFKKLELLRHAIFKDAFSGQLVGQDPKDEPASALLERIRAERAGRATKKDRATKNGRKTVA